MLFHFERVGKSLSGWVVPDNPATVPRVQIIRPDGSISELETNTPRPDVRDRGFHRTGDVGFTIHEGHFPDLGSIIDNIQIRDVHTGVLLYRPFHENAHLPIKIFRFEMQAMPYAGIEAIWDRNFSLYYNAVERYPFETMFGILNNPAARSIALSGRSSLQRYEHFLREREYKIVALLRNPLEELAERLLFVHYAHSPHAPSRFNEHLSGLEPLTRVAQRMNLERLESLTEAFGILSERQRMELSNPLIRSLVCGPDEFPLHHHVDLSLGRLSSMDLVGLRPHYREFSAMLSDVLGRDILSDTPLTDVSWVPLIAAELGRIKSVRALVALDLELYELAEEAVRRAIGLSASILEGSMP